MINPFDGLMKNIGSFLDSFSNFCGTLFLYLKYILGIGLLVIGLLTLMKLRGMYKDSRLRNIEEDIVIKKPQFVVGFAYFFLGAGILLNFLIYFLIFVLEPLPDRLIFSFFDNDFEQSALTSLFDVNALEDPLQKAIFFGIAIASLIGFLDILACIYLFTNKEEHDIKKICIALICGLIVELLFGFTTFLPLLLG